MRSTSIILVLCGLSVLTMVTAGWAEGDSLSQPYRDSALAYEQKLLEIQAVLESRDPPGWSDAELADYQVNMGIAVYNALVAYCLEHEGLPDSLDELVGVYLTQWPLNPQSDWAPVRVLTLGDGFAAGDIVFQECPPSYFSLVGRIEDGTLAAQSFELSVYGPSIDHGQESTLNPANADWGTIPPGAILSVGMYTEPAIDVINRARENEEAATAAAEQDEPAAANSCDAGAR